MVTVGCASNTEEEVDKEPVSKVSSEESGQDEKVGTEELDYDYINDEYGIKAKFENDWEINENYMEQMLVMSYGPLENEQDVYKEGIGLSVQDLEGEEVSLEDYRTVIIESLINSLPDFQIAELIEETEINGNMYIGFVSAYTNNPHELGYMQLFTIENDAVYTITYCDEIETWDQNIDSIDNFMIDFIIE